MSAPSDEELAGIAYQRTVDLLVGSIYGGAREDWAEKVGAQIIEAVAIPLQAIAFRQAVQELWFLGQQWGDQLLGAVVEDGLVMPPDEEPWPENEPQDQAVG